MSDVYQSELNPDDEPGTRLQEALRGADGKIARNSANDRRHTNRRSNNPLRSDRRMGDRRR